MKNPWAGKPGGSLILESLVREEMVDSGCLDEDQAKRIQRRAEQCAVATLNSLKLEIDSWRRLWGVGDQNFVRMTPRERQEAIGQLVKTARNLGYQARALGIPTNILSYYGELWPLSPEVVAENPDTAAQLLLGWRQTGTSLATWISTLSDKKRVESAAPTNPLLRVNAKDPELSHVARNMASFFNCMYGKPLPATITRICSIEFPDSGVTNNKITSILRDFDPSSH